MRVARWTSVFAALFATLALAGPASAQSSHTTSYHHDSTVSVTSDTTATATEARRDWTRIRFGVSGHGGGLVNGPEIGMGGISARIGVQLGDFFAVYYQPMGLVGAFTARPDGVAAAGLMFNSAMVDFTMGNMFSLGVGPSLDFIWGCSDTVQRESDCTGTDPYFGLNGRAAINIAAFSNMARHGLTLSVDVHPTFFDEDSIGVSVLGGIGFESF